MKNNNFYSFNDCILICVVIFLLKSEFSNKENKTYKKCLLCPLVTNLVIFSLYNRNITSTMYIYKAPYLHDLIKNRGYISTQSSRSKDICLSYRLIVCLSYVFNWPFKFGDPMRPNAIVFAPLPPLSCHVICRLNLHFTLSVRPFIRYDGTCCWFMCTIIENAGNRSSFNRTEHLLYF